MTRTWRYARPLAPNKIVFFAKAFTSWNICCGAFQQSVSCSSYSKATYEQLEKAFWSNEINSIHSISIIKSPCVLDIDKVADGFSRCTFRFIILPMITIISVLFPLEIVKYPAVRSRATELELSSDESHHLI